MGYSTTMAKLDRERLNQWIAEGRAKNAKYLVILEDTMDLYDPTFPLYIKYDENAKQFIKDRLDRYISILQIVELATGQRKKLNRI